MNDTPIPPDLLAALDFRDSEDMYVDGLAGLTVRNGIAKLNFFTVKHKMGEEVPIAALSLSISLTDMVSMTQGLTAAVLKLQEQGFLGIAHVPDAQQET